MCNDKLVDIFCQNKRCFITWNGMIFNFQTVLLLSQHFICALVMFISI